MVFYNWNVIKIDKLPWKNVYKNRPKLKKIDRNKW